MTTTPHNRCDMCGELVAVMVCAQCRRRLCRECYGAEGLCFECLDHTEDLPMDSRLALPFSEQLAQWRKAHPELKPEGPYEATTSHEDRRALLRMVRLGLHDRYAKTLEGVLEDLQNAEARL